MFSAETRPDENLWGLSFSLPSPFPFPSHPLLRSRPLKSSEGVWGSAVSLVHFILKI